MTTASVRDADAAALGSRVAAWLRVGGSWAAIAAAHGASDVETFKRRVTPHLPASSAARRQPSTRRPAQLRLF